MKKITLLLMLGLAMQHVNSQNSCASPMAITGAGLYVVDAINGVAPTQICTDNGANSNANPGGEWYAYTPTAAHTVTITTNITQNTPRVDTRFHVYTGTCDNLTCYSGDDDSGLNYSSSATFNVTANTTYIIAFDNRWSSNGFTFQLIENDVVIAPPTPISYITQNISTLNSTYNICVVDMNGDHKDDIVGVSANNLRIHFQGAGGALTYTDFPVAGTSRMPSWSMAAGDMNKDGYNDLLLGSSNGLSFWKSNSTGTAYTSDTPGQSIFCQRTNFVDINNDGHLDAFSCHDVAPNCYYLNDGANNFTFYQTTVTPGAFSVGSVRGNYATLWTDFDNDGDVDLFISKCSGLPCELHRNDGNGVFTDISAISGIDVMPIQTWSSAIADFDNDGDMDIIIGSNGSVGTKFFRNNVVGTGAQAFTEITAGSGWDLNTDTDRDYIAYDFDNDGYVDVMGGGNKIMFNHQGDGTFVPSSYPGINLGAVGDLNNDGFLDIQNGSAIRYAVPNGNHWVTVTLSGIQSNSNGIGARVEIYGAFGKQIRDVRSGEGFEYMSSINAHFGIGANTAIEKIIVRWPSGTVDTINNPNIDQYLNVVEGGTLAVGNYSTNGDLSLSPNPAKHVLNVKWNTASHHLISSEIYDLNGRLVSNSQINNESISVESIQAGTYIILLKDDNGKQYLQKFIKI